MRIAVATEFARCIANQRENPDARRLAGNQVAWLASASAGKGTVVVSPVSNSLICNPASSEYARYLPSGEIAERVTPCPRGIGGKLAHDAVARDGWAYHWDETGRFPRPLYGRGIPESMKNEAGSSLRLSSLLLFNQRALMWIEAEAERQVYVSHARPS